MAEPGSQAAADDPAVEVALEGGADDEVAFIARMSSAGPLPEGVRVVTRFGDVATLRLARARTAELVASDAVAAVEAPRNLRRVDDAWGDDDERAWAGASTYTRRPEGLTATGRGVVIGVLDWGCDFAHPAFRREDGTTRLLALWDQRAAGDRRERNRWGYGRIFRSDQIDAALAQSDPYAALGYEPSGGQRDGAHGTHVTDIAAGSGVGAMTGVAPDAAIVFVHLSRTADVLGSDDLGDSATVLEALDFVFSAAGDRPCVVNMSVGAHGGPHDGTTLVEQGIDRAVSLERGRAVVGSAGNYFTARAHAQGRVREGGREQLRFRVPFGDPTESELELWYPGVDRMSVKLIAPGGEEACAIDPGQDAPLVVAGNEVGHAYHHVRHSTNGDHHVDVLFRPEAPDGTWTLELRALEVQDGHFHAWIERDRGPRPIFVEGDVDRRSTTGTLCNGKLSITVGAYDPHVEARSIGAFSSAGPTRDGRVKPEIVAPGVRIRAARSTPTGHQPEAGTTTKSGTSMAAPHVTGTVALVFEAAGERLSIAETRALLFASCERPDARVSEGARDLHRYGYGYLDIVAAEQAARRYRRGAPGLAEQADESSWQPSPPRKTSMAQRTFSSEQLRRRLESLPTTGGFLEQPVRAGDVLVRRSPGEGVHYAALVVSDRPENAVDISMRGVPVERAGAGSYVEVLEMPFGGGPPRVMGRRLTDAHGRLARGQSIARHEGGDLAPSVAPTWSPVEAYTETIDVDDVATEMNGLRCHFDAMYTSRRSDGTSRMFHDGAILFIQDWNGTNANAVVDGFDVPKLIISPYTDRVRNVRWYVVGLEGQRRAIQDNARRLREWISNGGRGARWEAEKRRLEDLLARRQTVYSRMWVRQMMYNRFDIAIAHWTRHYNTMLRPADDLDPSIVKSMFYQESRLGTSGRHLMPPPSDWSSGDRHPIRSRFNIGQAIDSWGPQQWLMIREMAPAIHTRYGLDALEPSSRWLGMSNDDYASHPTFMTALREFFEYRSGGQNLMGTAGRDLHEDYGFWIRTAIRWLFLKYERLRTPTWSEAVRAYNGSGTRARAYRDAVMARVGSDDPFAAESVEGTSRLEELMGRGADDVAEPSLEGATASEASGPSLDRSARLEWIDLTRIAGSTGERQVFYVLTGAPPGTPTAVGDEGKAIFHLRVSNTNSVYNHQDVTIKHRVLDVQPRRQFREVVPWTSRRGSELEDESSRTLSFSLAPSTLEDAYDSDSPLTRLEVEYHWREAGESRQAHYNRTGLDFVLVAPIEFMLRDRRRLHHDAIELNDPQLYKDDFWIPVTGVEFTEDIRTPFTFELQVTSSVTRQAAQEQRTSTSRTTSATTAHTVSNTFSMQLSGELGQTGSASANIEIFELGLQQMFKLGASLGYSRTATDTSSSTVASEFSRSLAMSRSYAASQAVSARTTITVSPPDGSTTTMTGPTGTGGGRTTSQSSRAPRRISVGVYLYPLVTFFEVDYVRFDRVNRYGQATRRTTGTVVVPYVTGWRLTSHRGG